MYSYELQVCNWLKMLKAESWNSHDWAWGVRRFHILKNNWGSNFASQFPDIGWRKNARIWENLVTNFSTVPDPILKSWRESKIPWAETLSFSLSFPFPIVNYLSRRLYPLHTKKPSEFLTLAGIGNH